MTPGFGARLAAAMDRHGPLCVGIDPHPQLLAAWGLADTAAGLRRFSSIVLEALAGQVAAIKPQVAFYERHGAAGMAVLEDVVGTCRENGTICIMDAKRGDIGSTMQGYADAFLREGGPFAADALTVSPYLGVESLAETVTAATGSGRGVFILALTSNPEGRGAQQARTEDGTTVAAAIARTVRSWNEGLTPLGDVGLVVGATIGDTADRAGVDLAINGPILAPGVGAQGGRVEDLAGTFHGVLDQVLVNSSRDVLRRGPEPGALRGATREVLATLEPIRPRS